uniref:Chloride channel protein n=1 Tax=Trypanosoma congolense (strain IL3000) TaxID=1068625 RepID=G0UXU5_TRYCI|nr:putative chloride channel protein [Trypanosoma congolense IL3000]
MANLPLRKQSSHCRVPLIGSGSFDDVCTGVGDHNGCMSNVTVEDGCPRRVFLPEDSSDLSLLQKLRETLPRNHPRFYNLNERSKMERYESVDTMEPATTVYKDHLAGRSREPRWFIWVFVILLGMATSFTSILVVSLLHVLNSIRYELLGYGLNGFSFNNPNRYPERSPDHAQLDFIAMFEGAGVGLYGIDPRSYLKGYVMWVSFSFVTSLISCLICASVSGTVGSGAPEVMAYLNGVDYAQLGSFRVLLAKIGAIIFSVASGACTGYYGTLMLVGAMLGAQTLQRHRYIRFDHVNIIECFRNPRDRRTIVVIGAAAGVASAFSVSIGGLMVVFELISTTIPVRFALYVFAASLVSSLFIQVYFSHYMYFSPRDRSAYSSGELISDVVQIFASRLPFDELVRMHILYFIPAVVIGVSCGVLSSVFVRLTWFALVARRHFEKRWKMRSLRVVAPIIFTIVYVSIHYWVVVAFGSGGWTPGLSQPSPLNGKTIDNTTDNFPRNSTTWSVSRSNTGSGPCVGIPDTLVGTRDVSVIAYYGANGFFCAAPSDLTSGFGSLNSERQVWTVLHSYASLAFANADSALQTLLSLRTETMLSLPVLIVFLLIYFVCSALFLGISLCGDTLLPTLVVGATIGRIVGVILFLTVASGHRSSWVDPGIFALLGAGSFVGGTTGLTFSICTILMESTGQFQHMLPLMMGIVIAKKTAEMFTHNINAVLLEAWCVPMLNFLNVVEKYPMFNARHVMSSEVVVLETVSSVGRVIEVLQNTRHNAFPIESVRDKTYKGVVMRRQLEIVLWHIYYSRHLSTCTYEYGKKVETCLYHDNLQGVIPPLDKWLGAQLDLSPYIDYSGFCVLDTATLPRTYQMFLTLGLRHLTVVDSQNHIVGIITRKDLMGDRIIESVVKTDMARRRKKRTVGRTAPAVTGAESDDEAGQQCDTGEGSKDLEPGQATSEWKAALRYEFYRSGEWCVSDQEDKDSDDDTCDK